MHKGGAAMSKWFAEWLVISFLMVLSAVLLFIIWAIWPLLTARLVALRALSPGPEGVAALALLMAVSVGFAKLMCGNRSPH